MRVSRKAEYAVRAMVGLARSGGARRVRSEELARRTGIPKKFLEAILVELRKAGLVRSRRGPDGGYELGRAEARVTVADIRAAVEGPLSLAPWARPRRGNAEAVDEAIREVWLEAEEAVRGVLQAKTLDALVRRIEERCGALDWSI
jgi:Rrf2 family protein